MNINDSNTSTPQGGLESPLPQYDPDQTLRLLAQLPPPEGLAGRVHRRLQAAPPPASSWLQWMPLRRLQFAGAAVLVAAVAVSGWTLYEIRHTQAPASAHAPAVVPTPATQPASGLSTAGAERHPASLKPIKVPPAPKKKPSAAKSRVAKPPAPAPAN